MNKFAKRWKESKGWNPFSAEKLFAQIYRWRRIKKGHPVPSPSWVTVDPSNICQFDCLWCNAKKPRESTPCELSSETLIDLAEFLPTWGVEAVTIAGGGEPLTNIHVGDFIERLVKNGVQVGVITNGLLIDEYIEALSKCIWVSVSIDAGKPKTHHLLKRTSSEDIFRAILENIFDLATYSQLNRTTLGSNLPAYGITYKYLLYPKNIGEVFKAARLAKEIGCRNICYRPAVTPFDKVGTMGEIIFSEDEIKLWETEMKEARELDDDNFNVYEYTYRVGHDWKRDNCFEKCWSIFMSATIQPSEKTGAFNLGLCCDRRGDKQLNLLTNEYDVNEIHELWGRKKHWNIHESIDHTKCPQCTHIAHNQVYEQAILNDCLTYRFQ